MRSSLILPTIFALSISIAFGQAKDPVQIKKDIDAYADQLYQKSNGKSDPVQLMAEVRKKAQEAIAGVDPGKIAPKDAYAWAQVFSLADAHKSACDLAHAFLSTNPPASDRFEAQMLMMSNCNAMGEGKMIEDTLPTAMPADGNQGFELAESAVYELTPTIADSQGPKAAYEALRLTEKNAFAKMPTQKDSSGVDTQREMIRLMFIGKEGEFLSLSGHRDEGLKLIDDYAKSQPAGSAILKQIPYARARIAIYGEPATDLKPEKTIGDFTNISGLKGKVVILDYFAHWCGPCKASFPDEEKMYSDLKDQGLAIIGVTDFYGFYEQQNMQKRDMTKEAEYAHMTEFVKEHNLPWPLVFGKDNFLAYGAKAIPHVVVIDKMGVVREIEVGYTPESFGRFRAKIEKMLAE
jgi:thiol-disulfide isomerase/thioredoxin